MADREANQPTASRFQEASGPSQASPYWQRRLNAAAAPKPLAAASPSSGKQKYKGKPGGKTGSGGNSPSPTNQAKTIFPLPRDVRGDDALAWKKCDNFSLALQRLLPYQDEQFTEIDKKNLWKDLVSLADRLRAQGAASHGWQRQQELINTLKTLKNISGLELWARTAKTGARLSIGFGNTTPLETGLTLHRLYGVPYLPGTALKGICRSWALAELAAKFGIPRLQPEDINNLHESKPKKLTPLELLEKLILFPGAGKSCQVLQKELKKIKEEMQKVWQKIQTLPYLQDYPQGDLLSGKPGAFFDVWEEEASCHYRQIFGSQECRGEVCFYDAFPQVQGQLFELDIINVHYQQYYSDPEHNPPADYYSPVPNYFLTVAPGVTFQLLLTSQDKELLEIAGQWLTRALGEFGLGAKTALGYGEMTVAPEGQS